MRVLLYKDEAPKGGRKVAGRFASATADSVTLLAPDGGSRTLKRTTVQKVRIRLPIRKRRWAWTNLAIVAGVSQAFWIWFERANDDDLGVLDYMQGHAISTLPALPLTLLLARTGVIYNARPPSDRDP